MRVPDTGVWCGRRGDAEPHHASLWSDSRVIAREKVPSVNQVARSPQSLGDWRCVGQENSYQMTASCLRSAEPRGARPVYGFSYFFACLRVVVPWRLTRHVVTKPFFPIPPRHGLGCRHRSSVNIISRDVGARTCSAARIDMPCSPSNTYGLYVQYSYSCSYTYVSDILTH